MGTVTDLSSSAKLAAATVTISSGSTQTDTSGNFIFDPQPANGVYTVTITKSGYSTVTINNVIVSDTAGATLTVGMAPTGILNFTTASGPLLHAETGVAYNQAVKITGGVGPYIFSKAYGTLPSGLALNPELATISGTPTTAGNYTFAVGVTDKLGAYAEREFSIEVTIPFVVTSAPLPRGTIGTAYSSSLTASGGKTPYSYSVTSGSLPSGLTLTAATGSISGKPTTAGTYTFTVQVADASSRTTSQSFTILVDAALSNTTGRLNDGIVGTPFTQTFTATGGLTPYTWGVYSGLLPMGLTLNPTTGIITGTPVFSGAATSSNTLPFVISLQDSYGRVVYRQFAINVLNPLLILTSSMPNGLVSTPYSEAIRTSGGNGPYSFSLTGQLPPGLSINATTGIISGTPSATGLTNLQVTVTDSTWPTAQTKSQNLSIRVTSSVTITTGAVLTNAKKGTAITPVTLAAKGGTPAYSWSIVGGALPSGLALDPASGIISGTPSDKGDFVFTIRVTDSVGNATGPTNSPPNPDKQFTIHISDTLAVTTGAVPNGALGLPYYTALTAAGGLRNYTWAVKTGTLPAGLALDAASGAITGTPSSKITSSVTFEVTDSDAPAQKATTAALIFEISDTLSIYDRTLSDGRRNNAYSANVRAQLGTAPYSWSLKSGTLPTGTTFSQNAGVVTISGTPTTGGTFTFELEVNDNGTPVQRVSRSFTVTISSELSMTTTALKAALRTAPYAETVVATGGLPPYTFSITTGSLPAGLSLTPTSGTISGTITLPTGQSSAFTVRVIDSGTPSAFVDRQFSIFAIDPLVVTTDTFPGALQMSSYGPVTLAATGGISPYSWSLANSTTLPQGITLSSAGLLSGTALVCGSYPFTAQVADSAPVATTAQKAFTLDVSCVPVNAACGTANGTSVTSAPLTNLCSLGTGSAVSGVTSWNWTCFGLNGGANATCSAGRIPLPPSPITWRHQADGIIAGMTTDGNSITGVAQFWQEPDQNWQIVGQGDFDGDGIRDFVWQNSTTGQVYIMLMSGPTTIKAGAVIYTEPNTNWKIVATADFNGDGKAELLWWNSSTGQVYVMPMNGLSVALGGSLLATGFDPTWHIQGETEWRDNLYGRGVTTTTK